MPERPLGDLFADLVTPAAGADVDDATPRADSRASDAGISDDPADGVAGGLAAAFRRRQSAAAPSTPAPLVPNLHRD